SNADRVARDVLRGYGLEKYFTHGLGHGVGLEVHESPRLAHVSDDKFKSGMVFTVEPGIYIEGWGGIRIEDTVVLTHDGPERLTKTPKKLICI
ncbi:MAG TPA: M24 family metallopeptidase, partial [bacterium]|nr:M24 family metallopeptidase [bacterium]